jgi:hypothetical protein
MRVVVEIHNGCISDIVSDEPCEVIVIDRDELAERLLPDGDRGYVGVWDVPGQPDQVDEQMATAGLEPLNPT